MSHPLRVRGLKQQMPVLDQQYRRSHPLRVRGLKQFGKAGINEDSAVAPFTGAWIETQLVVFLCQLTQRRTLYGCDHQASVTL